MLVQLSSRAAVAEQRGWQHDLARRLRRDACAGSVGATHCPAVLAPLLPPSRLPLKELRTPKKDRVVAEKRSPIHGVVLGATDRSYLMRDNQVRLQLQ